MIKWMPFWRSMRLTTPSSSASARTGSFIRHCNADVIGIHPIRLAIPVETQRRQYRDDAIVQQFLADFYIHPLDLAGEQMVDAVQNAQRMGDQRVGTGSPQIVGREPFQDFVREPVGGRQRQLESRLVRDARPVEIGGGDALLRR